MTAKNLYQSTAKAQDSKKTFCLTQKWCSIDKRKQTKSFPFQETVYRILGNIVDRAANT